LFVITDHLMLKRLNVLCPIAAFLFIQFSRLLCGNCDDGCWR
jgi:hypothetical protein